MEFSELVKKRYSVRAYKADPVEEEKLGQVLEACRLAPTAANRQAFQLIVTHTAGRQAELRRIYQRDWFVQAPLIICACTIPHRAWVRNEDNKNYGEVDASIVVDHLTLAAVEVGLGTCWVAAFNVKAAREILGLPADVEPVAFVTLGYPAGKLKPKKRKALSELVRYENW